MMAALLLSWVLGAHSLAAQTSTSDSAGVAKLRQEWVRAYSADDATAMEALYVRDAVRLPYDAPAQTGREAIISGYRASFATRAFTPSIVLQPIEIVWFGNRAVERGAYREILTPRNAGPRLLEEGKYVGLMERDGSGRWRYVWSIFNRDGLARRLDN
jgi:uncharacterized protein (TIGR02246 family)